MVQNEEWAFTIVCSFDPSSFEQCMSVVESSIWYFDTGAIKHITSQRNSSLHLCMTLQGILSHALTTHLIQLWVLV